MERKQIIHIASEVVVISGLAIYFKLKTNALSSMIEKLKEQLETQEEMIGQLESKANSQEKLLNKHDQIISSLLFAKSKPKQSQPVEEYQYMPIPQKAKNKHSSTKREVHPPTKEERVLERVLERARESHYPTKERARESHPTKEERVRERVRESHPTKEERVLERAHSPPSKDEDLDEDLDEQILNELNELNNMSPVNESHKSESSDEDEEIIEIDTSLKKKA